MPYKYPDNVPERIKSLPAEAQRVWIDIYNNAFEQYKDRENREELANRVAWAGLKRAGWVKQDGKWKKIKQEDVQLTEFEEAFLREYEATYELKDVEIFSVGEWKGDKYTEEDIDALVEGTNEIIDKVKPRVKLGHDEKQALLQKSGYPAGGWITRLRRKGKKVLCDIKDVPKVLYNLIKNGAYKRVSSEIIWDYKEPSTGKVYPRILDAIAFLGADLPAVTNLDDIAALYDANKDAHIAIYQPDRKEVDMAESEREKNRAAQKKRSDRYGIGVKEGGNVTKPGEYENLSDSEFADPVNYRYPIDEAHIAAAVRYFSKPENRQQYSRKEQGIIWERIMRAAKKFGLSHQWNDDLDPLLPDDLKNWAKGNKKMQEVYKVGEVKVFEHEGKKFVSEEDFLKLKEEREKLSEAEKKAKEYEEKLQEVEREKRKAEIKAFVEKFSSENDMRILPKQKPVLMALMESISDNGEKHIYEENGKKVEATQKELLQRLIELQPNFARSLFSEFSSDRKTEDDEPSKHDSWEEAEAKIKKYMQENKGATYRDAVRALYPEGIEGV